VVEELPEAAVVAVMTPASLSVRPEDDLADIVTLMLDSGVRSVPIVDDGALVGIVSRRDVLRCVARRELTSEDVRQRRDESGPAAAAEPTRPEGAWT
jgi:CBS-domain-containing membrane protein